MYVRLKDSNTAVGVHDCARQKVLTAEKYDRQTNRLSTNYSKISVPGT